MAETNEQQSNLRDTIGMLLERLVDEHDERIHTLEHQVAELQQQLARSQGGVHTDG